MRTIVAGGPKTGKTTLAGDGRHTDDEMGAGWSEASESVSFWFDDPGPWDVEGVAVPRALRKWLARNPKGKPCDRLIWLEKPYVPRNPGQEAMAKGCSTVFWEILPELIDRGVEIEYPRGHPKR